MKFINAICWYGTGISSLKNSVEICTEVDNTWLYYQIYIIFIESLVATIKQTSTIDISHLPAIQHGQKYEPYALQHFASKQKVTVEQRGFMLHPRYNWIGASVDGVILTEPPMCLEIKCPLLTDQACSTLKDLALRRKSWFLSVSENDQVQLRKSHKYHYQCQLQMSYLELMKCVFYVYLVDSRGTFLDDFSEVIEYDSSLVSEVFEKCQKFHQTHLQ